MTVTASAVRAEINASVQTVSDEKLDAAIAVSTELVLKYVGEAEVPTPVFDRAVLLASVEQINQDKAPNGVLNQFFDAGTGENSATPVRIGRDPMKPAYPVLDPWVSGRFFCA